MTFNLTPSRTRSNDSVKRNKFSKSEDSGSSVQKLTPFQADSNTILRLRRELSRKLEGLKTFIDNPLNKTDRQTKKSSTKLQRNNQKNGESSWWTGRWNILPLNSAWKIIHEYLNRPWGTAASAPPRRLAIFIHHVASSEKEGKTWNASDEPESTSSLQLHQQLNNFANYAKQNEWKYFFKKNPKFRRIILQHLTNFKLICIFICNFLKWINFDWISKFD